jgi:acylglycerol lipase
LGRVSIEQQNGYCLPILEMNGLNRFVVLDFKVQWMNRGSDAMGDGPRSQALYDAVGSEDKIIKRSEGLLHEIFNEPEHEQVMADMESWLTAHL